MTEFTYTGEYDGHPVTGKVTDGKITGNPFVAIRVQALVDSSTHVGLGPWSGAATLDDDILARATIAAIIPNPTCEPAVVTKPLPPDTAS